MHQYATYQSLGAEVLTVIAHVLNSLRPCELQGEEIEQVEALEQFFFAVATQYPVFARAALEVWWN